MNQHRHKHEHCKHEHMKYCSHCDRPYCVDCGQEWNLYQPYLTYSTPWVTAYSSTGTVTTSAPDVKVNIPEISCSHVTVS